jgi:hypothetical protein
MSGSPDDTETATVADAPVLVPIWAPGGVGAMKIQAPEPKVSAVLTGTGQRDRSASPPGAVLRYYRAP